MASGKSLMMKQYRDLVRNIESFSDGQATVKQGDDDDLTSVSLTFNMKGGPYRGAIIDFNILLADEFPSNPPTINCLTQLYHPNLDVYEEDDGNVCLNLLDEHWSESCTLEDVVQGLLFLIHNPNISDPLSSLFCGDEEYEEFEKDVRISLRGGTVQGETFNRALPDNYESDNEDEDTPKPVSEEILTETTRDVLTKQASVEPEITTLVVNQPKDEVTVSTQAVTPHRFLRNAFINVEKIFTSYFVSRHHERTIIESSVDPADINCVT